MIHDSMFMEDQLRNSLFEMFQSDVKARYSPKCENKDLSAAFNTANHRILLKPSISS